jgi:hypothetical protein
MIVSVHAAPGLDGRYRATVGAWQVGDEQRYLVVGAPLDGTGPESSAVEVLRAVWVEIAAELSRRSSPH